MKINMKKSTYLPKDLVDLASDKSALKLVSNRGFVVTPRKILRCYRMSEFEKVLLIDLISLMGEGGYAFPSHGTLAFRHGKKSIASVKNALNSLREKGFITWSTGGADLGTNHYRTLNLFYNPYLIMSEFTHYCVDKILEKYRGVLQYEAIYSAVLGVVEKTKNVINTDDDPYGKIICYLFNNPDARDSYQVYCLFGDILKYHIETATGKQINIDWWHYVKAYFEEHFPYVVLRSDEKHPIEQIIENPYDKLPIQIEFSPVTSDDKWQHEFLQDHYKKAELHYANMSEAELWREVEELIISDPWEYFGMESPKCAQYQKLVESNGDYRSFIREFVGEDPREFLISIKMIETSFELFKIIHGSNNE